MTALFTALVESEKKESLARMVCEHREEIERLRAALRPFAKIELSSLYGDDDNESYTAFLCESMLEITSDPAASDFRRQDVLRARAALPEEPTDGD